MYCHTFDTGPGHVAVVWSRDACDRFAFEYRSDIVQRMNYADPAVSAVVSLAVPPGRYLTYDFLSRTEVLQDAGNGLELELDGTSCALVYFGADTPQWREFLSRVRQAPDAEWSPEPGDPAE